MSVTNPDQSYLSRPTKPLKPFKLYRKQRLAQQATSEAIFQIIKQEWKALDRSTKEKMQLQYELQYNKYLQDKEQWEKKHGEIKLMKEKGKRRQKSREVQVQMSKGSQWDKSQSRKRLKKMIIHQDEESFKEQFHQPEKHEQSQGRVQQKNKVNRKKNKKEEQWGQQLIQDHKDQQLIVNKRQVKGAEHLIFKVNEKVNFLKNRMSFKNADKDFKYKQHIKQKLKECDSFQEINLFVDIPKVLGGKSCHLQGALFLKNVKQTLDPISSQVTSTERQSQMPKDRKSFYQTLGKELKLKKSEVISESELKKCFQQSSLDQSDNIDHQDSNKKFNRPPEKVIQPKTLNKIQKRKSNMSEESNASKRSIDMMKYQCRQQSKSTKTIEKQSSKHEKITQNMSPLQQISEQGKRQRHKDRKKMVKKQLKNHLKGYIEQQAENSGQQDNINDGSSSDENTDISSLIDNDIIITEKDQVLVHNKFISDMIEKEQREYEDMRKRLQKKYIDQEQNLRKRMKEAAKKYSQKEKEQQSLNGYKQEQIILDHEETENESCTANNNKKLKQLEMQLGIKPKIANKAEEKSLNLMTNIDVFEKAMNQKKGDLKKPVRGGMRNIHEIKGVQANIKIKSKV